RARHAGADAGQSARGGGDRHSARGALRRPPRHGARPRVPARRRRRRGHAELLDRATPALRLLLPARCGAAAARADRGRRGSTHPPHGLYVIDGALTGHGTALLSALHHLMLPALTLGFAVMAPLTRMVRATML